MELWTVVVVVVVGTYLRSNTVMYTSNDIADLDLGAAGQRS